MRWRQFILCLAYASLITFTIFHGILLAVGWSWRRVWLDSTLAVNLLFHYIFLSLALAILMQLLIHTIALSTRFDVQRKLRRILNHQPVRFDKQEETDQLLADVARKLNYLTDSLQKSENLTLLSQEEIIEKERKRIARDLHDTVSQELFAAAMILSGLESMEGQLSPEMLQTQLSAVGAVLETAQKDLRILLLHLRPTELENKTLIEGIALILKEVSDKSNLKVSFQHEIGELPRKIEEHLFRITQEVISNTLKHARAQHLDVYLKQQAGEVHFRLSDDGQGFDTHQQADMSYGMKNIRDRVQDMAGTLRVQSAPGKGVTLLIRVPLVGTEDVSV